MKVLFAHDAPFYFTSDKVFSLSFTSEIWQRYLNHFSELTVVGRAKDYSGKGLHISSRENVSFIKFPNISSVSGIIKKGYYTKIAKQYILSSGADAVIARLPSEIGLLFINAAKELNKPIAVEVVGSALHAFYYHGAFSAKLYAPYGFIRMRNAVKKSSHSIYVTSGYLQRLYPCKGVTSNASNVNINELKHKNIKAKEIIQITTVGAIDIYYKGFDVVIKALALLKDTINLNFQYNCIGKGSEAHIKNLAKKYNIEDRVNIINCLSKNEILNFFDNNTDLYIQPSRTEGLPRTLIEAMSRGCPALASSVGGIPELLESKYLHLPGDYKKLAKDIRIVALDEEELRNMSKFNTEKVSQYLYVNLEDKRNHFWNDFATLVKQRKTMLNRI